jgi:hypothetical protein
MNAAVLRDFFLGKVTAAELAEDLVGTTEQIGHDSFRHHMNDMDSDFAVTSAHLVCLCDTVLEGSLDPERLAEIGFGMIASDHFLWDSDSTEGEIVGKTIYDWSSPEVNFALNVNTVKKFRHRLITGESTFTKQDHSTSGGRGNVEYRSARDNQSA